jgi:hAT family C-terminal dimerisation region
MAEIKVVQDTLMEMRVQVDERFHEIYISAVEFGRDWAIEPSVRKICGKQIHRSNMPNSEPEIYYRTSLFVPLIDSILECLSDRFGHMHCDIALVSKLVPSVLLKSEKYSTEEQRKLAAAFPDMPAVRSFSSECDRWRQKWFINKESASKIDSFVDALRSADEVLFPNIRLLFLVSAARPSSTASNKRSFSSLKRLKTYLRSTMLQDRLTGLALLHIHQDIPVSVDAVIDKFARLGAHRLAYL